MLALLGGLGGCASMRQLVEPGPSPQVALDAARIAEGAYLAAPRVSLDFLSQVVRRDREAQMAVNAWRADATPGNRQLADAAVTALAGLLKTQPIF